MKVVINKCWGGLGLSHEAVMRYAELASITLYPIFEKRDKHGKLDFNTFRPYEGQKEALLIMYLTEPLSEDGKCRNDDAFWSPRSLERNDPLLVQVVEELGHKADDKYANLKVVEIPDDVQYVIYEYDGMESIHEVHRSWN